MSPLFYPTAKLAVHPAVKYGRMLPAGSAAALALFTSINTQGLLHPLSMSNGMVVDGRERLRICRELGMVEVPGVEICAGELHSTILHSLLARRHLTKSALAYLAFPHLAHVLAESKARGHRNIKQADILPPSAQNAPPEARTAEDMAQQLGVSRRLFFCALNLHGHFNKRPELRTKFEGLILYGALNEDDAEHLRSHSLARVLQEIAKEMGATPPRSQTSAWLDKVCALTNPRQFSGWEKLPETERQKLAAEIATGALQAWPEELLRALAETYQAKHPKG